MSGAWWGIGVASPSVAGAASSKAPVAVGDLCSCTGPEASTISQTTDVSKAWASWVNAHGGLAGHKVDLIVRDDGYSPAQAVSAAHAFISQDHVVAIFDNSDVDTSWAPIVQKANVPVIGGQETDSGYQNPDFYPSGGTLNYSTSVTVVGMKKAGLKTVANLYCVEVAVCSETAQSAAKVYSQNGLKQVYSVGIAFGAPSYAAQCLAAKQAGARSVEVGDATAIVEKVAQDCAAQGYNPVELTGDGIVAISMLKIPAFSGMIATQANLPWFVHNSATAPFYSALKKYVPQELVDPNFGEAALQAWSDGVLLQHAVIASHPGTGSAITTATVKKGLYGLAPGDTLDGLAAQPIHFVRNQPANFSCWFQMSIKNSEFVWSNGQKPLCAQKVKAGTEPGAS
jgi:branched-chain amino acid transport system substrate-binding protein